MSWAVVPALLIPVALIRLASLFYVVRMQIIGSSRIGHLCGSADMYLAHRQIEGAPKRTLDLFGYQDLNICNRTLANMWARKLRIVPFLRYLMRVSALFPGHDKHVIRSAYPIDTSHGYLRRTSPFLEFNQEERNRGESELRNMLGDREGPIVTVFNRDSAYLDESLPSTDWSYHDYRNSSIDHYEPAMEWLADKGYIVLRMGFNVAKPISLKHENIIDYAVHHRSELMDVYITSLTSFQVAAVTGLLTLGTSFRKPAACVNASPFLTLKIYAANENELFIPKLHFIGDERRPMSIKEIISSGAHEFYRSEQFLEARISTRENDGTDILNIAHEIEGLVSGVTPLSKDDISLQKAFWKEVGVDAERAFHCPQPSPSFLRRHEETLFGRCS